MGCVAAGMRGGLAAAGLLLGGLAVAAVPPPLPDPLTLEQALELADAAHPTLELAAARRDGQAASLAGVVAESSTRVDVAGELRAAEPSRRSLDRSTNDSSARLLVRKRLYDFGYTAASTRAAELRLSGSERAYLDARQERRLEIMERYFDVLLADLAYARDNEAMATAFVDLDKARDRAELGQVSDVALLALEAAYQETRRQRGVAANRQRLTRAQLATALNRPGELPANLVMPSEPDTAQPSPEFEILVTEVLAGNPRLQGLQAELAAAEQRSQPHPQPTARCCTARPRPATTTARLPPPGRWPPL